MLGVIMHICGVYKIENLHNHKCYIGQSTNIYKRWNAHKNSIEDYPLYRAFRKYGIESFSFEIIEECTSQLLNEREQYWINHFDSYNNGYNQIDGLYSRIQPDWLDSAIADLQEGLLTNIEIANKYNVCENTIVSLNTGKSWFNSNITYPLRPSKVRKLCPNCNKIIITKGNKFCDRKCYIEFRNKPRVV